MKKRFFAGLLACLMVVGLLPLSMLLKPVSAKAYTVNGNVHVLKSENMKAFSKTYKDYQKFTDENVDEYFSFYASKNTKVDKTGAKWEGENEYKSSQRLNFGGKAEVKKTGKKNVVVFKTSTSANVKIWWVPKNDNDSIIVYNNETYEKNTVESEKAANTPCVTDIQIKKSGEYSLGASTGAIYIYKIEVTEESKYNVTVVDSATTETTGKVNSKSEGETFTLKAADTTNFLYWVNSYGRIVSRDAEYSFPVYYSDTYTAVYKSAETTYNFMTDYDQVYKTYTASDLTIPTSPVKYGYEFDYWKIGETKVSTVEEIKSAGTGTDVEIKPVYKEITENVSITINGVSKEYKKNEVVTADATALENFMYWHVTGDESKILSYNDLYSFYADDKISSITAKCGTDTVEKSGIITHVTNYSDGNSKTFVFEFTVPEGYTIEFAGVVVSSTSTEPTLTDYEYIRGRSSSAQTYRYSWTKLNAGNTTWNVRPILKYSDGQGNIMTIDTSTVQSL